MKAICPREGLLSACQVAGVAVAARDVKPILSNIKAAAGPNGCTLLATDLDLSIRLEVRSVRVETPGEALLPANRLTAILRESTDEELTVEAAADNTVIRGQFNEFEMPGEEPGDFPEIPSFTDDKYHELQAGALRELIRRTIFAVDKKEANHRYSMHGVLWETHEGKLRLVGTDGRRLALATGAATNHGATDTKGQTHVVPVKAMGLLERLLQDASEPVRFVLRSNEALFKTDRATICTRLVEGRFPNYRDAIPDKLPLKVTLEASRFQSAVRQASIMTEDESKRVTFTFSKKRLTLQASGAETGRAKAEMPIEYDGKDVSINFDPGFVVEMLRVLPVDAPLTLELADSEKPAVFRSGPDYLYVVVPLT
jgi:DNA polymerase-3 subunit beta